MRFIHGPIPHSLVLNPKDEGWTPMREPSSIVFVIVALVLSLPFLVTSFAMLLEIRDFLRSQPLGIASLISFLALMIPIHEMIHAVMFPCRLGSKNLILGAWLSHGLCYALYDSPVSRNRLLVVLAAPFIVMSSTFAIVAVFIPTGWRWLMIVFVLIHASICTGDFISFVLLINQVPTKSLVHNDGWKTYWASQL